jgi:hypothetical protein
VIVVSHLLITASAGFAGAPGPEALPPHWRHLKEQEVQRVKELIQDFDRGLHEPYRGKPWSRHLLDSSHSGESMGYYYLQLSLDPLLTMYEVTHHRDYLEFVLDLCENMIAATEDRDADGHPEWKGLDSRGKNASDFPDLLLNDFQGSAPLLRAARIVFADPGLCATYGERSRRIVDFADRHILDKWLVTRRQRAWFRSLSVWSDKTAILIRMELDMYGIRGSEKYLELAREVAEPCKSRFVTIDPHTETMRISTLGSDTGHTCRHVTCVIACMESGVVFDRQDVDRMVNTFLINIWDGDTRLPRFHNFHDGGNSAVPDRQRGPYEEGEIYDGWVKLGRFNDQIQAICYTLWQQIRAQQWQNVSARVNSGPHAKLALPANLAYNIVFRAEHYPAKSTPGAESAPAETPGGR